MQLLFFTVRKTQRVNKHGLTLLLRKKGEASRRRERKDCAGSHVGAAVGAAGEEADAEAAAVERRDGR